MPSPVPVFPVKVDDQARLHVADKPALQRYLSTLAGKDAELIIRLPKQVRSLDQNAYWHAVPVRLLAEHTGYSEKEMSDAMLGECFGWKKGPVGRDIPVKESTADLTVDEFTQLIDWALKWGPEFHGVPIPAPGEAV